MAAHGLVRPGSRSDGRRQLTGPPPYRVVDNQYIVARPDRPRLHRHAGQRLRPDHRRRHAQRLLGRRSRRRGVRTVHPALYHQLQPLELAAFSLRRIVRHDALVRRSRIICQNEGISLNGIVLLSSFLNSDIDYNDGAPIGGGDWAYVLYLPTEAATAWYHHVLPVHRRFRLALAQVESFALSEYLDALGQGALLSPDRYNDVVAKLHRVHRPLGITISASPNLRVPYDRFENELLRDARDDRRTDRFALPDLRARPPRDFARLGRDRRRDRLGVRDARATIICARCSSYKHAAALSRRDLRPDLRGRRDVGSQARRQRAVGQRRARPCAGDDV